MITNYKYLYSKKVLSTVIPLGIAFGLSFNASASLNSSTNGNINDLSLCMKITDAQRSFNLNLTELKRNSISELKNYKNKVSSQIQDMKDNSENKEYLLLAEQMHTALQDFSTLVNEIPENSDEALAKIQVLLFEKIKSGAIKFNDELEYKLRIALLPAAVCDKVNNPSISSDLEFISDKNKIESQLVTGGFLNPAYKAEENIYGVSLSKGYQSKENQKQIEVVALNINLQRNKNTVSKKMETNLSGGIVLSLPKSFKSPVEKLMVIAPGYATFNTRVGNMVLDQKPRQNHFVAMTFKDIKSTNEGLQFGVQLENPHVDLYFSNKIFVAPNMRDSFLQLIPSYEDKSSGLLVEVYPEFCRQDDIKKYGYTSYIFCETLVQTNVAFNHLVMELKGYKLGSKQKIVLPSLRLPQIEKNEKGGAGLLLRFYSSEQDRYDSNPLFSTYFGSDSLKIINQELTKALNEKNQELQNKVIGGVLITEKVIDDLKKTNELLGVCRKNATTVTQYDECVKSQMDKIIDPSITTQEVDPTTYLE